MSDLENEAVIDIADIAEEFRIPFLATLIDKNEKVCVNTDHMSGWFEEGGENFHFCPNVDFHPLPDNSGFKIVLIDVDLDAAGKTNASIFLFLKTEGGGDYSVQLDDDGHIFEERKTLSQEEASEVLPYFPPMEARGFEHFKFLFPNPTLE